VDIEQKPITDILVMLTLDYSNSLQK